MRRMISDNQLNSLISRNIKIIELDTSINYATITQEQMDILFPKDAQGNIYKPDYYIVITDETNATSGGYAYLAFWSSTSIRFNRLGTNSYYTWTIGPNDTKFTQKTTRVPELYQHNIYIKTHDLYIFLTIICARNLPFNNILDIPTDQIQNTHISCTGYLTQGSQGPITSITRNITDNKYYFSLGTEGKDYAFFEESDLTQFVDEVVNISVR